MAESFRTFIHSIPLTHLWSKFQSFFQKGFHDGKNNESAAASATDKAEPQPKAMLDLEAGLELQQEAAYNVPADDFRPPPPSPAPHSGQNTSPAAEGLNPIAQIFKEQDLGKTIIGFLVPLTGVFQTPYAPTSLPVRISVLSSLSVGFALLWNGILLRNISQRRANVLEQIGAAFIIMAVYGLISSSLPNYLLWIPWASFLMVLFPIFWGYFLDIKTYLTS